MSKKREISDTIDGEPSAKRVMRAVNQEDAQKNFLLFAAATALCYRNCAELDANWRQQKPSKASQPFRIKPVGGDGSIVRCWFFEYEGYGYFVDSDKYLATHKATVYRFTNKRGEHLKVGGKHGANAKNNCWMAE
jgi:hypothetical protein